MSSDESDGPAERTVASEGSLSPMRRTIASRLQESYQEAVHVTVSREIGAEAMLAAADADLDVGGERVDASVTDVLLCALSDTLAEHPAFNATFEDGTHRVYEEHNVGVAVAIEEGLVTPVIEDVGSKSLAEVARARQRAVERVQAGDYTMKTFQGGTFTVSNLGPLGVDSFDPIINPPEISILGVNRIREEVVPDGDGGVAVEKRLNLDLSFDHRVVDGADAARFLRTLAGHLEEAETYAD